MRTVLTEELGEIEVMKRPSIFQRIFRINLNKLANYKGFTKGWSLQRQANKINEEIREFNRELNRGITERTKRRIISEGLDVITALLNFLFMLGMTTEDFNTHIDKLNKYKKEKKYGN